MFIITCKSCASRLKVTDPALVGQMNACPKCGTMIEIVAPDGWKPPEDHSQVDSADSPDEDFDDIEKLLQQPQQQPRPSKTRKTQSSASQTPPRVSPLTAKVPPPKPRKQLPPSHAEALSTEAADDQPLLPSDQWTSAESQQRKKWLAIAVGGIAALLIFAAIMASVWNARNVARNAPENGSEEIVADDPTSKEPADSPPLEPTETPEIPATTDVPEPVAPTGSSSSVATPESPDPPESDRSTDSPERNDNENDQVAPAPIKPDSPIPPAVGPLERHNDNSPLDGSANANDTTTNLNPAGLTSLSDLAPLKTQLGELSDLLVSSGSSLTEFQNLAVSQQQQQRVGIPRYFIEPPEPAKIDVADKLALPCGGMRYEQTRLVTILREMTVILGVPFTLDTESILAAGVELNPEIDVDVADTDYATALDSILEPLGLTRSVSDSGSVIIHVAPSTEQVTHQYSLDFVKSFSTVDVISESPDGTPHSADSSEMGSSLVAAIQALIAPESWVTEEQPATISLADHQLTVHNTPSVHHQIETFLNQIESLANLDDPTDENSDVSIVLRTSPTRFDRVAEKLDHPTGLKPAPAMTLLNLLEQIHHATGLTVIVDWASISQAGWTPATEIPGYLKEEKIGELLDAITESMGLTTLALDESTLELTTFQSAASRTDLEIYPLSSILKGPLNEQQIMHLINQTLGPQLQSVRIRFTYNPHCQCLFLLAPQSIQKQVSGILDQLESL